MKQLLKTNATIAQIKDDELVKRFPGSPPLTRA
jgi:hypothetical protein